MTNFPIFLLDWYILDYIRLLLTKFIFDLLFKRFVDLQ